MIDITTLTHPSAISATARPEQLLEILADVWISKKARLISINLETHYCRGMFALDFPYFIGMWVIGSQ